jgi:hypothetical protein
MLIEVRIVIGEYTIEPSEREDHVWISHKSGEGMEIEEAKLAEALAAFYAEHF